MHENIFIVSEISHYSEVQIRNDTNRYTKFLWKRVIEKVTDCLLTTDVELNGNESSNDLGKNC